MISPIEAYKNQSNKDQLRKESFTFFNDKYFKRPWEEYDFLETEERMQVKKLQFFIPGRIYTFQYDPLLKSVLDFYDTRPMVLVHSTFVAKTTGNIILQGLNLNFLPEKQRVQTMELFYRTYKQDLEEAERAINKDSIGLLKQAWNYLTDWYFTLKIFNTVGKIGYQWAYRNYIIGRMKEPVIIELEDWEMIPYFVPKEFKGKSVGDVWGEYLAERVELSKVAGDEKKSKINKKKYKKP